jgi:hypothetical protein
LSAVARHDEEALALMAGERKWNAAFALADLCSAGEGSSEPARHLWRGRGRRRTCHHPGLPIKGGDMYARVATFESDASHVDDAIEMVRTQVESGETPAGLEGAKMLMLVNRETGKGLGVTLFESEEAMRRGDEALNAMNPGGTERRTSVEFFEVPVQTVR